MEEERIKKYQYFDASSSSYIEINEDKIEEYNNLVANGSLIKSVSEEISYSIRERQINKKIVTNYFYYNSNNEKTFVSKDDLIIFDEKIKVNPFNSNQVPRNADIQVEFEEKKVTEEYIVKTVTEICRYYDKTEPGENSNQGQFSNNTRFTELYDFCKKVNTELKLGYDFKYGQSD